MSPLESALTLLERINEEFSISQEDYKNVRALIKELVCALFSNILLLFVCVWFFLKIAFMFSICSVVTSSEARAHKYTH